MISQIQGLRGVAIISVVLFHLWPTWFPNGFLGVDTFFVLSGFLMARIFYRVQKISYQTTYDFYCKRIQRIFPLYYIVIPPVFICCQLFLIKGWILANNQHSFYAIFLLKNFQTIWLESDYFQSFIMEAGNKDLFLHTWSLSVEIQFYLLVPVIFWILSHFSSKTSKISTLALLSLSSYIAYYHVNPTVSFNSPMARMWQFCTEHWIEEEKELPSRKLASNLRNLGILFFLFILIFPGTLWISFARLATTLAVGFLLTNTESDGFVIFSQILTNKVIVYIGDISYSMYLVHWPIILLVRSTSYISYFYKVVSILGISMFLFHYYESFYRNLSRKNVFILTGGLILFNIGLHALVTLNPAVADFVENLRLSKVSPKMAEVIRRNEEMTEVNFARITRTDCVFNQTAAAVHPAFKQKFWGVYDCPRGFGDQKVLIIGNCFANMQADLIRQEFKGNYSEFKVITVLHLFVLFEYNDVDPIYQGHHKIALKMMEEFEPDYTFIATRHEEVTPITVNNIMNDRIVQEFNKNVRIVENATKRKVFMQGSSPIYPENHMNMFIEAVFAGDDVSHFHLEKEKADQEMARRQLRIDAIRCRKCEVYDTRTALLDGDHYLGFDPKTNLSIADNTIHITEIGLERWRPLYKRIVKSL